MKVKALNKLYVVVDTELEKKDGFNCSFVSKIYQKKTQPRQLCAERNKIEAHSLGQQESKRYVVAELIIEENKKARKCFIEDRIPINVNTSIWPDYLPKYRKEIREIKED